MYLFCKVGTKKYVYGYCTLILHEGMSWKLKEDCESSVLMKVMLNVDQVFKFNS